MADFKTALSKTLKHEGGFVDHPLDKGGATNKGITLATYQSFIPNGTIEDLKNISDSVVESIYQKGYWIPLGCARLEQSLAEYHFDFGVNAGCIRANRILLESKGNLDKYKDLRVLFYV
ncbi:MAG: glycoside hydrolase family 108 protein, partial [Anaerovoracaceae bacterium]